MRLESKFPCSLARFAAAVALTGLVCSSAAKAQSEAPPSDVVPLAFDSGYVQNHGADLEVVHSFPVYVDNASWLRLYYSTVELSGDPDHGTGSFLRITSMEDGGMQTQNAIHVAQWENSSAFFNGDAVLVEILAHPGTGTNRIVLKSVEVGTEWLHGKSQCGGTDDRILSTDPRVGRLSMGCTGWVIDDACGCFLSAGHCGVSGSTVVEFNVPLSSSSGSHNHPGPEDQYSVDGASVQTYYYTIGDDWAYFGTFPNSVTGLTAREAQGDEYEIIQPPAFSSGQQIRITGFGSDYDDLNRDNVNQTHSGNRVNSSGTVVEYTVDTEGGSSGSPVIFESTGEAIGIHTNGGCNPPFSGNTGCGLNNSGVQNALANPQGVCNDAVLANFVGSPTSGIVPLTVGFTDTSIGDPTSWSWSFGDGSTSSLRNPSHTYTVADTYTVSLTAAKTGSSDIRTRTNYIEVNPVPALASATSRNGSGVNPDILTSTSLPILGTNWTSEVDAGSVGVGGFVFVFVYAGGLPGTPTAFGELLLDPSSPWLFTDLAIAVGGISQHAVAVPADPAFAGGLAFAQAYLNNVAPSGQLTNAIDLVLGY